MADLNRIDAAGTVEICDGISQSAAVKTTTPSASDGGLVVREAQRGQQTAANSIPVVMANDVSFGIIDIKSADSASVDAFGNWRTSEPITIFDSSVVETDNTLNWTESLTGSATITRIANESSMRLRCTTASGDIAIRQTKIYMPYQPGKSLKITASGVMGALKANVRQRIGYFDVNNGIFFEQDGTNLKVVRRTYVTGSPVDNAVNQSSWNIDVMDGTGISGITLDTSKMQIFIIDLQWLGGGRVRMGFQISGQTHYCHEFDNANSLSTVYMTRPSLPVRYEIENTAATASTTDLYATCCTVISEGGYNPIGFYRSADNGITSKTVSTTLIPLLSIRLKSANNRAILIPEKIAVWVTNSADIQWQLILNGSLTGASFASLGTNSIAEKDTTASAITGGEIITSGYSGNSQPFIEPIPIGGGFRLASNFSGTADILTLAAVRIATVDATTLGQIGFREIF